MLSKDELARLTPIAKPVREEIMQTGNDAKYLPAPVEFIKPPKVFWDTGHGLICLVGRGVP